MNDKTINTIKTLEQLHKIRERKVNDLNAELVMQQSKCRHIEQNITTLTALAQGIAPIKVNQHVALMSNQASYKRTIQRVVDWQKQEQALAELEKEKIGKALLAAAKHEKSLALTLDGHKSALYTERARQDQKVMDALSTQSWLRRRLTQDHR